MFDKRLPLTKRGSGELDVWVQLCVLLSQPRLSPEASGRPVIGYFRNFGIRVPGPQPKAFLESLITDGSIEWEDTEVNEVDPMSLDEEVLACVTVPDALGVWYRSGRIYFSEGGDAILA